MPDWFYRTVARRVLFALPASQGRALALGVIGTLGRSRAGRKLIDFLGHMAPDPRLVIRVGGVDFPSRIGLGWRVDPETRATGGLARFGVACIEVPALGGQNVGRAQDETLVDEELRAPQTGSRDVATDARLTPNPLVPLLRRHRDASGREFLALQPDVLLPVYAWDDSPPNDLSRSPGAVLQVGRRCAAGAWQVPASPPSALPASVRSWRENLPKDAPLIVSGGVAGPADALSLIAAGADLVLIDAGLVFRGPGLVKRCNEALLANAPLLLVAPTVPDSASPGGLFRRAWPWATTLGVAMFAGGLATLALSLGRVLLPYDEHYLGLSVDALRLGSPKLFAFMAHDRGTLAGTMLGLGWLYAMLGWHGARRGAHGAKSAIVASSLTGFASFFAFFGFGYFDALHAFVAVALF